MDSLRILMVLIIMGLTGFPEIHGAKKVTVAITPNNVTNGTEVEFLCEFTIDVSTILYLRWENKFGDVIYKEDLVAPENTGPCPVYENRTYDEMFVETVGGGNHSFKMVVGTCDEDTYQCVVFDTKDNTDMASLSTDDLPGEGPDVSFYYAYDANDIYSCAGQSCTHTINVPEGTRGIQGGLTCDVKGAKPEPHVTWDNHEKLSHFEYFSMEWDCTYDVMNITNVVTLVVGEKEEFTCNGAGKNVTLILDVQQPIVTTVTTSVAATFAAGLSSFAFVVICWLVTRVMPAAGVMI